MRFNEVVIKVPNTGWTVRYTTSWTALF